MDQISSLIADIEKHRQQIKVKGAQLVALLGLDADAGSLVTLPRPKALRGLDTNIVFSHRRRPTMKERKTEVLEYLRDHPGWNQAKEICAQLRRGWKETQKVLIALQHSKLVQKSVEGSTAFWRLGPLKKKKKRLGPLKESQNDQTTLDDDVLIAVRAQPAPTTAPSLGKIMGLHHDKVRRTLKNLVDAGKVRVVYQRAGNSRREWPHYYA